MPGISSAGMAWVLPGLRSVFSLKGRIIAGFMLLVVILAVVAGASAWQAQVHHNNVAQLEKHSTTASLLQNAAAEGGTAALLLQRYVDAGDNSYIPEVQQHARAAVQSLSGVVAQGGVENVDGIATRGAELATAANEVMELRRAGDVAAASALMEEIVPVFRDFRLSLEDATADELAKVSDLRTRADRAGQLAFWLLIISGTIGAALGLAASILIVRSIVRPLSSLEATAVAASRGDLSVRAPADGPRELSHLGGVLNSMMDAVEARTQELRLANEELRQRNRQLMDARVQALTDPLTGLRNHRAFHQRLRDEVKLANSEGSQLALVMFDIDRFKTVNDSLGHQAGDEILRQIEGAVGEVVNPQDAYRYGGDEFAVLIPRTDHAEAIRLAEQIRLAVEALPVKSIDSVTVSLGVAVYPDMANTAEELVYRADMAMYWAKSTGKNRVGDWDGLLSQRTNGAMPSNPLERERQTPDVVAALVSALAAKDPGTRSHTERCSWYSIKVAEELGLSEERSQVVRLAALLHDVGKLAIPDDVLTKPGPLTNAEWTFMRQHPQTGMYMLSRIDAASEATPAVLHHHEHYDGSGYPEGLSGEEIPIASRILLVTDAFDAMTTNRPYRSAMPVEEAIEELKRHQGSQFDPKVVEAFLRVLERDGAHPLHQATSDGSTDGDSTNGDKASVRVDVAGRRASASQSSN